MNWMKSTRWSWILSAVLLLVAWPGVGAAQPLPNGVLYEVTENMKLKANGGISRRVATAALMGTVDPGAAICPAWLAAALGVETCAITAFASDSVSLVTGKGPVEGTFAVVIQDTNDVDGPELVILRGTLHGKIDLSPAVLGEDGIPGNGDEVPLGSINGKWTARGVRDLPLPPPLPGLIGAIRARGTFTGTFRLPFDGGGVALYVVDEGTPDSFVCPLGFCRLVREDELSLAVPTVRLEVTFSP